jgi:hypothetical protein
MLESKVDKGKNDADAEDPFRHIEWNQLAWLDLAGPGVEG